MGAFGEKVKMGCSAYLLFLTCLAMLTAWGIFYFIRNFLVVYPIRIPTTSHLAANRAREKIRVFQEIDSLKKITMTEIEINSLIREELRINKNRYFTTFTITIGHDRFVFDGIALLARVFYPPEKEIRTDSWLGTLKTRVKLVGRFKVLESGDVKIIPIELIIGKQLIPINLIDWLRKWNQNFLVFTLPVKMAEIRFCFPDIELVKR